MTKLSSTDLATVRKRPQQSKLYLSIFQPKAYFQCRVNNASAAVGDRVIPYDSVSLGTFGLVRDGMTMLIGTTPGSDDVGKVRVRSADASNITVSENSNIAWADNLYLTVLNYWELWPVYPRIIQNPSNAEDVIFYKDYDIAYSSQNSDLGTFVNIGPHRAVLLDPASNQAQVYYGSSGTFNVKGQTSQLLYNWFFEGATVTGSTSPNPGYITYNTPGHYVTRLTTTVTGTSISDTTYRYVSVYNAANPPIQKWKLESLSGSRDEGGHVASIKLYETTTTLTEHAVVVIFQDSYYGNTRQNIGGNFPNASDILFVGYIDKDSIEYDWEHSEVSFDALSLTGIMKKSSGFSVSVESKASPTKWYELLDMNTRRALYHYLRWHTTALYINDFQFVGDDYKIQYFDSDRGSMFDALDNHMQNTLIGQVVSDRQSKVWLEVKAMAYSNPTGSFTPSIMDIATGDWRNTPEIQERLTDDVSYMEYGGIAYSGVVTGTWNAYIGEAPGTAPGFYGQIESQQGLSLLSQSQLNTMVGNVFANKNSPYPELSMDMAGNYQNLDIAPQETVQVTLTARDTVRGVAISSLFIPDSVAWTYDANNGVLLPNVTFKQLVNGIPGRTVAIPPVEDIGEGWSIPKWNIPPFPTDFSSVPTDSGDDAPKVVVVHDPTAGWIMTNTFNTPNPSWYQINAGLTATQYQLSNKIMVCPNGAAYLVARGGGGLGSNSFIARADYLGGLWTVVMDNDALNALWYGSPVAGNSGIVDLTVDPTASERLVLVFNLNGSAAKIFLGSGSTWEFKQLVSDWGSASNGTMSIAGTPGFWVLTGNSASASGAGAWFVYDQALSVELRKGRFGITGFNTSEQMHVRAGNRVVAFADQFDQSYTISEDVFVTNMDGVAAGFAPANGTSFPVLAISPNGNFLCARTASSARVRSFDGGYSWSNIANLPVLVSWVFDCDPTDDSKWIAGASYMYYTKDFWNSYPVDKQGNLPQINPLYQLNYVKVISH